MAGNYYHDPRPFYGPNYHNLVPIDELFYGRREPPPWYMHQMPYHMPHHMPQVRYDEQPRSRSVEPQHPEQYIRREDQFREYRRPDMRDDIYTDYGYDMYGANRGQQQQQQQQQQKNQNHGGNHGGNNNNNNNNNNHGNKGKNQQKSRQDDSDDSDSEKKHKGGHSNNKSINHNHGSNKGHNNNHNMGGHHNSWSDNKGFRKHGHHRRSLSLTQTVLKKLGLRDDSSSSDSSDDDRRGSRKNTKKGGHGYGQQMKADHKPYTVRFDDQFYGSSHGHSHQFNNNNSNKKEEKLGEDHGSHGKSKGGGQPQGILKTSKNKYGDEAYSSDDENRGHKSHGNGKGGGADSAKKNAQAVTKQLGRSQSMDFRVNLCCENCERKVRKALRKMDVDEVLTDQWNNRVVVVGNAKPESVLKKLRSVKKDTHVWHPHK